MRRAMAYACRRLWGRGAVWTSRMSVVGTVVIASLGCRGDTATAPVNTHEIFWGIRLNHHAVTLSTVSPYDTLQLLAAPMTVNGELLPETETIQYRSNHEAVSVSSSGVITAHAPHVGAWVWVLMTVDGMTLRDSVLVNVTGGVSVLSSFSIHPVPGDSAVAGCIKNAFGADSATSTLRPTLIDDHHDTMDSVAVVFRSEHPTIAAVNPLTGDIFSSCVDQQKTVKVFAAATVYGRSVTDTVAYTVIPPVLTYILDDRTVYDPGAVTVSAGAIVLFKFQVRNDVVFDNPSTVLPIEAPVAGVIPDGVGGNIPAFGKPCDIYCYFAGGYADITRARRFPTPGTYHYHSSLYPTTGTIVVRARTP